MAELEIEPELTFEDGLEAGQESLDDVAERLIDEGFDEDEVEELLYDPAPRRGRGKGRRHHARGRYRGRTYDPAPRRKQYGPSARRYKAKRYGKKAKGMLGKLRPLIMPATAGVTFYAAYLQRSKNLNMSVVDAIMYDFKNFDGQAAMQRLQDKAGPVLGATIGGIIVKKYAPGKLKMIGDVLIGVGAGTAAKAILDPPGGIRASGNAGNQSMNVSVQSTGPVVTGMVSPIGHNPYGRLGGN